MLIPVARKDRSIYNKIVKNEFLKIEDIASIDDGRKLRYDMFVKAYNETREHGGINGMTPSEMFIQRRFNNSTVNRIRKQESVTYVGMQKCNLSL